MADVSFPQINTYQSRFPSLDFSALANLPNAFWQGQEVSRQNQLREALSNGLPTLPDGSIDWAKAASIVGQFDPELGMRTAAYANAPTIAATKAATEPEEIKLLRWWQENGGGSIGEPMRASEPQPSGTPGVSLQNAPAFIQQKLMPLQQQEAATQEGKITGQNAGMQKAREMLAPRIEAAIQNMADSVAGFDPTSFVNALGPLQGSDPNDSFVTRELGRAARFGGSVLNAIEGGTQPTYEIRSKIVGDANALALAIKPMVRNPGEGIWSDKDQALLNYIMGDLPEASNQEEYNRRLGYVTDRLNTTFGLSITKPKDVAAAGLKTQERLQADTTPYDAAEPEPPAPANASGIPGATVNTTPFDKPPAGMTREQVRELARKAVAAGADRAEVQKRLDAWGYGQ